MQSRSFGRHGLLAGLALLFGTVVAERARGQAADGTDARLVDHPLSRPGATTSGNGTDERLTVQGHRSRFQPAPVPGAPMGPPPDKPPPHLGRYKISGDQTTRDGYDAQTGAYIAPFGTAYTGASPVAGGLAPMHGH